jgi:hypothetical protein
MDSGANDYPDRQITKSERWPNRLHCCCETGRGSYGSDQSDVVLVRDCWRRHAFCLPLVIVLFRGSYAENTTPVQPLRLRRHSVRFDLCDCGGDSQAFRFWQVERSSRIGCNPWIVAWIMMLPIVLFAAPVIRNLTYILTRED